MAESTVQVNLPRAYRYRLLNGQMVEYGKGMGKVPVEMADNLVTAGVIQPYDRPVEAQDIDLPDDLPGRKALISAGYTKIADVKALTSFEGIEGVGPATQAKLGEYFSDGNTN